jgi:hypothetical protein
MFTEQIQATVTDSRHLELTVPVDYPTGSKVLIAIQEDSEREDFYELAAQGLSAAYSDDEPEYSLADIKDTNPDFEE